MRSRAGWLLLGVALFGAGPAAAYVRSKGGTRPDTFPLEWGRRCIPFWINEEGTKNIPNFPTFESGIVLSFAAWEKVDCSQIELPYQGTTTIHDVGADFRNVVMAQDEEWPHARMVIALTTTTFCQKAEGSMCDIRGRILDADIELNGVEFAFTNTANPVRTVFDLRNTVTHEVGHLLGLDHTAIGEATMFPSAEPQETFKASLHPDDIQGLCDIYPAVQNPGECEPIDEPFGGTSDEGCAAAGATPALPGLLLLVGLVPWRRRRATAGAGRG